MTHDMYVCSTVHMYACYYSTENPAFPTDRAAKLDIVLSILAAIVLVSLVIFALFPIRIVKLWRRRATDDTQLGMNNNK